jgi:hypothetical protein
MLELGCGAWIAAGGTANGGDARHGGGTAEQRWFGGDAAAEESDYDGCGVARLRRRATAVAAARRGTAGAERSGWCGSNGEGRR